MLSVCGELPLVEQTGELENGLIVSVVNLDVLAEKYNFDRKRINTIKTVDNKNNYIDYFRDENDRTWPELEKAYQKASRYGSSKSLHSMTESVMDMPASMNGSVMSKYASKMSVRQSVQDSRVRRHRHASERQGNNRPGRASNSSVVMNRSVMNRSVMNRSVMNRPGPASNSSVVMDRSVMNRSVMSRPTPANRSMMMRRREDNRSVVSRSGVGLNASVMSNTDSVISMRPSRRTNESMSLPRRRMANQSLGRVNNHSMMDREDHQRSLRRGAGSRMQSQTLMMEAPRHRGDAHEQYLRSRNGSLPRGRHMPGSHSVMGQRSMTVGRRSASVTQLRPSRGDLAGLSSKRLPEGIMGRQRQYAATLGRPRAATLDPSKKKKKGIIARLFGFGRKKKSPLGPAMLTALAFSQMTRAQRLDYHQRQQQQQQHQPLTQEEINYYQQHQQQLLCSVNDGAASIRGNGGGEASVLKPHNTNARRRRRRHGTPPSVRSRAPSIVRSHVPSLSDEDDDDDDDDDEDDYDGKSIQSSRCASFQNEKLDNYEEEEEAAEPVYARAEEFTSGLDVDEDGYQVVDESYEDALIDECIDDRY